jgi:hypothetical protein
MKEGNGFAAVCSCCEILVNEDICPFCAFPIRGATIYQIAWDDLQKQYSVNFVYPDDLYVPDEEQLLRALPKFIADRSQCSCGSKLKLSNHKLKKQDGKISIEAIFTCQRCSSGFQNKLRRLVKYR